MNDRAVSEVLGFTLVFALILSAVALVSVVGFNDLDETRQFEQSNNAERAFDVLADNMDDVLLRGVPSRATEIKLTNAQLYTAERVRINVTAHNTSGTTPPLRGNATYEFRPIVYEGEGETQIVYSAGAVFRDQREGGLVVREPPFVIEEDRIHLPIADTRSDGRQSIGGSTIRVRGVEASRPRLLTVFERGTPYDQIDINVTSPRYDLWAEYLSEQPGVVDGSCSTDDATESVSCELADETASGTRPERLSINLVRINVIFEQ